MRILKNRWFEKFAKRQKITDRVLCEAVQRAEAGLIDADLGGGLIKQRIARAGAGKSGGFRTIMIYRFQSRAIFVFGFAKSGLANIGQEEEAAFRKSAKIVLALSEAAIEAAIKNGTFVEVRCDEEPRQE